MFGKCKKPLIKMAMRVIFAVAILFGYFVGGYGLRAEAGEGPATNQTISSVPEKFREYIRVMSEPVEYRKVNLVDDYNPLTTQYPEVLTAEQVREDANEIDYLFNTAYAGKYYAERHGVRFGDIKRRWLELAQNNTSVKLSDMENIIDDVLRGVCDRHLSILGNRAVHRFYKHLDSYFSDILLEKRGGRFVVIKSRVAGVKPDAVFQGEHDHLFRTLSRAGVEHFLLGALSYEQLSSMSTTFDGQSVSIPLHPCRMWCASESNNGKLLSVSSCAGLPVIKCSSLCANNLKENEEQLNQLPRLGVTCRNKPTFILDVANNSGGNSTYTLRFFQNLLNLKESDCLMIGNAWGVLRSPATTRTPSPLLSWEIGCNEPKMPSLEHPGYRGRGVVLANRFSVSSAESTVIYGKTANCMIVGENSGGALAFTEPKTYQLSHSKIGLCLPGVFANPPFFQECRGILSDYWLDTTGPENEVARWINNPDQYQFEFSNDAPSIDVISFRTWEDGYPKEMEPFLFNRFPNRSGAAQISVDAGHIPSQNSLRIANLPDTGKFCNFVKDIPIRQPGIVKISFHVKGLDLKRYKGDEADALVVAIYQEKGKNCRVENSYNGNFDWKEDAIKCEIKECPQKLQLGIANLAMGTLWIDDIRLEYTQAK